MRWHQDEDFASEEELWDALPAALVGQSPAAA